MNKVEKFMNKDAKKAFPGSSTVCQPAYKEGFIAAIALDLPVKFAEWKDLSLESFELRRLADFTYQIDGEDATLTNKELYQYWIENIYTHE